MKHIIHTDNDNYIIGYDLANNGIELPEEVFNSTDLTCWKYENGEFTFDQAKKDALENARLNAQAIEMLKAELKSYDYIGTKIAMGVATKEDYAEEIAYTETLRQRIRELE